MLLPPFGGASVSLVLLSDSLLSRFHSAERFPNLDEPRRDFARSPIRDLKPPPLFSRNVQTQPANVTWCRSMSPGTTPLPTGFLDRDRRKLTKIFEPVLELHCPRFNRIVGGPVVNQQAADQFRYPSDRWNFVWCSFGRH
jgi:hypothetical protein